MSDKPTTTQINIRDYQPMSYKPMRQKSIYQITSYNPLVTMIEQR